MTPEERRAGERRRRRQSILDKAQEIIFQKGFENTTIEDIAVASGYTKRSVYLYFKDREEIFYSVTARGQRIFKEYLEAAAKDADHGATVERFARALFLFTLENPEFFELIMLYELKMHTYTGGYTDDDSPRGICQNLSMEYGSIVVEVIRRDIEGGRLKTDLTAKQLMLLFWGQVFGLSQILAMRRRNFSDVYGIEAEKLFSRFVSVLQRVYDGGI